MKDLVIIGSGPAGLSAAVYAYRGMLDVTVVEKQPFSGGQIVNTEQVDNYLGLCGINGFDMGMKFREHVDSFNVPFTEGEVIGIEQLADKKGFKLTLDNNDTIETKTVLIATGASHKKLGLEGENKFAGAGVSYCATCDGAFFKNKEVALVGGGDVALEDALYLSKICKKVYLIHRREGLRGAKVLQEKMKKTENIEFLPFYEVESINGENVVESLTIVNDKTKEKKELSVSGLFVAIGMEPHTDFAKGIVAMDDAGYIKASEDGITDTPGIFVAGDVRTKNLRQVVTAVSDGANGVYSILSYMEKEEI